MWNIKIFEQTDFSLTEGVPRVSSFFLSKLILASCPDVEDIIPICPQYEIGKNISKKSNKEEMKQFNVDDCGFRKVTRHKLLVKNPSLTYPQFAFTWKVCTLEKTLFIFLCVMCFITTLRFPQLPLKAQDACLLTEWWRDRNSSFFDWFLSLIRLINMSPSLSL